MTFKYLLIAFLSVMICMEVQSQQLDQDEIRKQLEADGIDEEEVRKRLVAEGYDPNNIDLNNPAQIAEMQAATERIIQQMKSERLNEVAQDTLPKKAETTSQDLIDKNEKLDAQVNDVAIIEIEPLPASTVYGQNLYREGGIKFYKKSEYIQPSPFYILGPGDNISVAIWGSSEANFNQEISNDGYVKFDKMPRIYLSGLSLADAKKAIRSKLQNNYNFNSNEFEVKISASRNLNVFIGGDVIKNGTYNISSLNTAINALAAAGGPTDIGSLRNIQLMHANGNKEILDLYKFLQDPSINNNFYLQDNDYIIVPVASKIVSIEGAINRSLKYELLERENLQDLIGYAGGLKVNALRKNIKITRYDNGEVVLLNVDLSKNNGSGVQLMNGDRIEVSAIQEDVKNAVYVEGAIENAGSFALTANMKLSDLMLKTVLRQDAILDIAYLVRLNEDKKTVKYELINIQSILNGNGAQDFVLETGDKLIIRGKSEFATKNSFTIGGAVRSGGIFDLDSGTDLRVSDAIYLSGGLTDNATNFAYIIRKPPGQLNSNYISIDLDEALGNPGSAENRNLMPGDVVKVYDQSVYFDESFVTIQGAIRSPQEFKYDSSLTLKDVILQAGGLKLEAASNKIDIFRIEILNNNKTRTLVANASIDRNLEIRSGGDFRLKPFDQIVVRKAPEFELQRSVFISGEVRYPGKFFLIDDNSTILDIINDAGGLTDEAFIGGATLYRNKDEVGFIVVDLEKANKNPKSTINVILQEGDNIEIPKMNNLVTIKGAVNKTDAFVSEMANADKTNFIYEEGKGVIYYIESAGGFLENADKSRITVSYPNGEKHRVKKFLFFKNYPKVVPGSVITVDYKKEDLKLGDAQDEDIDWGNILSNSIAQATAILSLILLIQNVD
jgi:protein involved in polysaccharide export with SLBB domain